MILHQPLRVGREFCRWELCHGELERGLRGALAILNVDTEAFAKLRFQMQRAADASHPAMSHDADTRAQRVGLVHGMRRQDDGPSQRYTSALSPAQHAPDHARSHSYLASFTPGQDHR